MFKSCNGYHRTKECGSFPVYICFVLYGPVTYHRIELTDRNRTPFFPVRWYPLKYGIYTVYILLSSVKCVPCQSMSGIYGREFWTCSKVVTDITGQKNAVLFRYISVLYFTYPVLVRNVFAIYQVSSWSRPVTESVTNMYRIKRI